ncbi:MAG: lysophospholipid acyltransferase family protein [Acidimicrobiia bacterium]|nr:lysophospholipid acyltransferase family protein [Acidimicrobiia bacterium]
MSTRPDFSFEPDPELPGSDRANKYGFGSVTRLLHTFWTVDIVGGDHVPLDGPALICPNHLSFCDSLFLPAALPRRVWGIGKAEYMDSWKTKYIFPAVGMIPVDRTGGDAAQAALDTAASVLDRAHLFMIYPEGTRSRSGDLHKGRTGAARLAIRCNAPIVPVGMQGTVAIQPPDSVMLKPFKTCTIRIGAPMWPTDFGSLDDPRLARTMTDAGMYEISQLSGQAYVDSYAGKSETPAPTRPSVPTPAGRPKKPRAPSVADDRATPVPVGASAR